MNRHWLTAVAFLAAVALLSPATGLGQHRGGGGGGRGGAGMSSGFRASSGARSFSSAGFSGARPAFAGGSMAGRTAFASGHVPVRSVHPSTIHSVRPVHPAAFHSVRSFHPAFNHSRFSFFAFAGNAFPGISYAYYNPDYGASLASPFGFIYPWGYGSGDYAPVPADAGYPGYPGYPPSPGQPSDPGAGDLPVLPPPNTPAPQPMPPAPGLVNIQVPVADAEVWFNDRLTQQAGKTRQFQTPPLTAGGSYSYNVTARWMVNGQPVLQSRTIYVQAGVRTTVDFNKTGN